MLNIFSLVNGRLVQEEIDSLEDQAPQHPIWVDMESPTVLEKRWVKQHYGLAIPLDVMDEDIEGVGALLRGRQRRTAYPQRLSGRRRRGAALVRVAFILNQHNTS